jgi:hypothetical protein
LISLQVKVPMFDILLVTNVYLISLLVYVPMFDILLVTK